MNVQKFIAKTSREALKKVKKAFGDDAIILSNKNVNGMVEIMAMDDKDYNDTFSPIDEPLPAWAITPHVAIDDLPVEMNQQNDYFETEKADIQKVEALSQTQDFEAVRASIFAAVEKANSEYQSLTKSDKQEKQEPIKKEVVTIEKTVLDKAHQEELQQLKTEMRMMRGLFEQKITEVNIGQSLQRAPIKADVLKECLSSGFSSKLSHQLVDNMPEKLNYAQGVEWVKTVIQQNLLSLDNEAEILEKGGIYALVGSTGVGKTTTTAKLAAKCVMRHGPSKLALITTDGYRIGAYEQLRIYGKILGVMVLTVKDEAELRIALNELKNKHMILIDTVGMSQRDKLVNAQSHMLSLPDFHIQRILCLNATSNNETLSEVVRSYRGQHEASFAGCILTKLDEAATVGGALDIALRHKLKLLYVANGQRVPEDIHLANKLYLVDKAFKLKRESAAFELANEDIPLMLSAHQSLSSHLNLGR